MKQYVHPTRIALGILLTALTLGACNCDEQILIPVTPGACEPTFNCPNGFEYRNGECRASRCQADSDCCPGQACNVAAGFCADQFVSCTDDPDCEDVPGQTCITFRGGSFCGYPNATNTVSESGTQSCASTAECGAGRTCFNKRCVTIAPCEGGCPSGQICDVDSNTCFEDTTCELLCQPGQMLVVADPDTQSGPQCCLVDCACETLPPVLPGQIGWHAEIALTDTSALVSAYDPVFGDLVVTVFNLEGEQLDQVYVDGFPTDGPLQANPNGPRGGRFGAGPNVGEHTSIVVDSNNVFHVAYYDRDEGNLKYANFAGGTWATSVVDDTAHVGMYTSIAIGPDGNPWISYMMVEGTADPDPMPRTGLKVARANSNMPMSPSDWTLELIDSRLKPPPPCGGGCASGEVCAALPGGPECAPESTACDMDACDAEELCADVMGQPTCVAEFSEVPLDDLIEGTGLFTDLVVTSTGAPLIVYYDRLDGDLRLASSDGMGGYALRTLDGDDPMEPSDVGQHATIALSSDGTIGIAYFDATRDDLVYYELGTRERQIVDDGITPPDLRLVGADASLSFDAQGQPAIAYQDPTLIDLLYARRTGSPAMWSSEILRGAPDASGSDGMASGFYAAQVIRDGRAYISNVDVTFDEESNLILDLSVLVHALQ